jgi:hypothetical protein
LALLKTKYFDSIPISGDNIDHQNSNVMEAESGKNEEGSKSCLRDAIVNIQDTDDDSHDLHHAMATPYSSLKPIGRNSWELVG